MFCSGNICFPPVHGLAFLLCWQLPVKFCIRCASLGTQYHFGSWENILVDPGCPNICFLWFLLKKSSRVLFQEQLFADGFRVQVVKRTWATKVFHDCDAHPMLTNFLSQCWFEKYIWLGRSSELRKTKINCWLSGIWWQERWLD